MQILIVEDNPAQVRLTQEAFLEAGVPVAWNEVHDGESAVVYLKNEDGCETRPRPDLIILDWNLPKKIGAEVLQEIKSDPDLNSIPIVVLSSSGRSEDVSLAYQLHANFYIRKPARFDELVVLIKEMERFFPDE